MGRAYPSHFDGKRQGEMSVRMTNTPSCDGVVSTPASRRLSRCLYILNHLQSGIGYRIQDLAGELGVSSRTILRDLDTLKGAGVDLRFMRRESRHVINSPLNVEASVLAEQDLAFLLVAAHVSALSSGKDFRRAIRRSTNKLLAQVASPVRDRIVGLINAVAGPPPSSLRRNGDDQVKAEIVAAIQQRRCLHVTLTPENADDHTLPTKIVPSRLVVLRGRWYLVGQSPSDGEIRRFDLQQICLAERTPDSYEPMEFLQARNATATTPAKSSKRAEGSGTPPTVTDPMGSVVPNGKPSNAVGVNVPSGYQAVPYIPSDTTSISNCPLAPVEATRLN